MSLVEVTAGPGRAPKGVQHSYAGPLTEADQALLAAPRESKTPPLKRMRDRHHTAARAFACGMTTTQVRAVTGYDTGYLSILQSDPAFQKLVNDYRGDEQEDFVDIKSRLNGLLAELVNIVQDRVEDDPTALSLDMANELIKTVADRSGHAPVTKSQATVAHVDIAEVMRAAREKLGAG